jgi:hypothetical protein
VAKFRSVMRASGMALPEGSVTVMFNVASCCPYKDIGNRKTKKTNLAAARLTALLTRTPVSTIAPNDRQAGVSGIFEINC